MRTAVDPHPRTSSRKTSQTDNGCTVRSRSQRPEPTHRHSPEEDPLADPQLLGRILSVRSGSGVEGHRTVCSLLSFPRTPSMTATGFPPYLYAAARTVASVS